MKKFLLPVLLILLTLISCKKDAPPGTTVPEENPAKINLRTPAPQFVSNTTASLYFEILDDGGEDLLSVGVCWSTNESPTIKDSLYSPGKKTGSYYVNVSNLKVDTRYFARAFATNKYGTVYGNRVSFITVPLPPSVVFIGSTDITQTGATLEGRVINDGFAKVTERGFVWDTINDLSASTKNRIAVGSDTGRFSATISGLKPGFYYYVAAYATNKAGTYFNRLGFYTLNPAPPAIITTIGVVGSNVVAGGTITAAEGITVGERGITTIPDFRPELTSRNVPNGSGTGTYAAILGPATSGSRYRVQAYANFTYRSTASGNVRGQVVEFVVP